jgi:hypothetical protein
LDSKEVYSLIRKNIKKIYEDVKITDEEIADIMANGILKREIIDSEESKKARKDVEKLLKKADKAKEKGKLKAQTNNIEPTLTESETEVFVEEELRDTQTVE